MILLPRPEAGPKPITPPPEADGCFPRFFRKRGKYLVHPVNPVKKFFLSVAYQISNNPITLPNLPVFFSFRYE